MNGRWPHRRVDPAPEAQAGVLHGRTLILTRPAEAEEALARALAAAGAEVLEAPAIEFANFMEANIAQCRAVLAALGQSAGWLVLPSPTAVGYFAELLQRLSLAFELGGGVQVAVIGQGSADRLKQLGLPCDFVPPEPTGASLAATLPAVPGTPVVIAGSSQTRAELREGLQLRGFNSQVLPLYAPQPSRAGLRAIRKLVLERPGRVVVATSPSAVDAIVETLARRPEALAQTAWVALGPTTYRRLIERGLAPGHVVEASRPTAEGLIEAVLRIPAAPPKPESEPEPEPEPAP